MKKSKYISIMFLLVFFIAALPVNAAVNEELLTLEQAKELALKNSLTVQQSQLNIDKADKAKRDADAAYSKLVANYFTEAQESAVVSAREGYRAALNAYNDSKVLYENLKKSLEYDVENLYFTILNTENELRIMEYDLRLQADLVKIEQLKFELGMSTKNNLQQAGVILDSLHSAYNTKNTQMQNYLAAMNRYIGRESDHRLRLDNTIELSFNKDIASPDETYLKALANNLQIKQYERIISEKEKDIDWYGYNQSDKVENLKNTIKEASIAKENAEKTLKQSVSNIYNKLALNQRNISNTKTNFEVARKNYEYNQQRYELGIISLIELKKSQKAFEEANKEYVKAEYDYYLVLRELELAEEGIILTSNNL